MVHKKIIDIFRAKFPTFPEMLKWFPSGHNCVRIRLADRRELIFSYNDEQDWGLMTLRCSERNGGT